MVEKRKRLIRLEHLDTLTSMNILAFMLKGSGCNVEAILLVENCF